ncbi:CD99 antigen-like protein 2 isoform X5 [Fundulus heteroclitus]|uniref:CD99 antigen-like protein 2 isoform X5 n=1 Tax=Fundulus heteroclitus TaxID=8078 RepID=UPI00165AC1B3|nr:CD99 antigen-like protein 2 isoform X5 [Fundulus heteroclitus]
MLMERSVWALCVLLLLQPLQGVLSQADFDLADAFDGEDSKATPSVPTRPGKRGQGTGQDFSLEDLINLDATVSTTTTKAPAKVRPKLPTSTAASKKPRPKPIGNDFNLADALDENQKPGGGHQKGDTNQNTYDENSAETTAEVGTIAGIISAVGVALVGAISSYISYQKKKLCFGIQQSLNADINKAEVPEGVVATEPHAAQQTLLDQPKTGPPSDENAV